MARPAELQDVLAHRGRVKHRSLVLESILDAQGGVQ